MKMKTTTSCLKVVILGASQVGKSGKVWTFSRIHFSQQNLKYFHTFEKRKKMFRKLSILTVTQARLQRIVKRLGLSKKGTNPMSASRVTRSLFIACTNVINLYVHINE